VPVHFVGTAAGVKSGGILQVLQRQVEVECLPLDIPEAIEVDVSALEIHDSISLESIAREKVVFLTNPDTVLVTVLQPRLEVEEEAEKVEEEQAEPEVVGKGKKESEEAGEE
jgi:large subunit ribosomal protein L25